MKKLQKSFTMNADKMGNNLFTQIKRDNNVAIYHRTSPTSNFQSFEVFTIKTIEKGSPLPNGKFVEETYESYPGHASFGKTAYECIDLFHAEERFDQLLIKVKLLNSAKEESKLTGIPIKRGRRPSANKISVPIPTDAFTMKSLIQLTNLSQPFLYLTIKQWIANGKVKILGNLKTNGLTRGRSQVQYKSI